MVARRRCSGWRTQTSHRLCSVCPCRRCTGAQQWSVRWPCSPSLCSCGSVAHPRARARRRRRKECRALGRPHQLHRSLLHQSGVVHFRRKPARPPPPQPLLRLRSRRNRLLLRRLQCPPAPQKKRATRPRLRSRRGRRQPRCQGGLELPQTRRGRRWPPFRRRLRRWSSHRRKPDAPAAAEPTAWICSPIRSEGLGRAPRRVLRSAAGSPWHRSAARRGSQGACHGFLGSSDRSRRKSTLSAAFCSGDSPPRNPLSPSRNRSAQ
jgi:hypothetical protein